MIVAVPPLSEQRKLLDSIAERLDPISQSAEAAGREIIPLREHRTRLITDVVTGKLDVREASARLPDEVEESEPLDEVETLNDADEDAPADLDAVPHEAEA